MIPDRKWSPDRKLSPNWTGNDPEPQVIPDVGRKWSRQKRKNSMEFGFSDFLIVFIYVFIYLFIFLFIYLFIYFHQLNDVLDEHAE